MTKSRWPEEEFGGLISTTKRSMRWPRTDAEKVKSDCNLPIVEMEGVATEWETDSDEEAEDDDSETGDDVHVEDDEDS